MEKQWVQIFEMNQSCEKQLIGTGKFLAWGLERDGNSSRTAAIIMDDDGYVSMVRPEMIRFIK